MHCTCIKHNVANVSQEHLPPSTTLAMQWHFAGNTGHINKGACHHQASNGAQQELLSMIRTSLIWPMLGSTHPPTHPPTCMLLQFTSSHVAMTCSNTTPVFWHLSMLMALHLPFTW